MLFLTLWRLPPKIITTNNIAKGDTIVLNLGGLSDEYNGKTATFTLKLGSANSDLTAVANSLPAFEDTADLTQILSVTNRQASIVLKPNQTAGLTIQKTYTLEVEISGVKQTPSGAVEEVGAIDTYGQFQLFVVQDLTTNSTPIDPPYTGLEGKAGQIYRVNQTETAIETVTESELFRGGTQKTLKKMIENATTKIVCMGDSITFGYGSGGSQVANPYPSVLQSRLQQLYNNSNITVTNKGVSGNTSAQMLARFDTDVVALTPDCCVIMSGINDVTSGSPVDLANYKANIISMVSKCKVANIEVVLCTPTPTNNGSTAVNQKIRLYGQAVLDIATEFNLPVVDFNNEINELYSNNLEAPLTFFASGDINHPASSKYAILADILTNTIFGRVAINALIFGEEKDEYVIPLVRSPFVQTNVTAEEDYPGSSFLRNYVIGKTEVNKYVKVYLYFTRKEYSLYLRSKKNTAGEPMNVYVNGVNTKSVNFFATVDSLVDVEDKICRLDDFQNKNGLYQIEFNSNNMTGIPSNKAYLSEVVIKKDKVKTVLTSNYITSGDTAPTFETLTNIVQGIDTIKYSHGAGNSARCGARLDGVQADIDNGTVIFEVNGSLANGVAYTWFGNKAVNSTGNPVLNVPSSFNFGYGVYVTTTNFILLQANGVSSFLTLSNLAHGMNLSNSNTIRVEHSSSNIKVYANGSLIITYSGVEISQTTKGYFGFWSNVASAVATVNFKSNQS